ncbi:MAG: nucleoside triphosphate pyrophosphohydrolase [Pseudomonadota bacterium]
MAVMERLRAPDGCPWDREQTFESIAPYTIEEAYEVADAIERGDLADLKDELGDLLLQVVYHARIAEERGAFDAGDVARAAVDKMVRRHPHVFGDAEAADWDAIKAAEKVARRAERAEAGIAEPAPSLLDDVPRPLPALTRAEKLQARAARVGFDWPDARLVLDKLTEEAAELREAAAAQDADAVEDEFGDLLFVMVNLGRHLRVDPESALRRANAKFTRRFGHIERALAAQGRSPDTATLADMETLWAEAKQLEKNET